MTDLEITRLAAEAMGFYWSRPEFQTHKNGSRWSFEFLDLPIQVWVTTDDSGKWELYVPLTDDAQCFALVKRFGLHITAMTLTKGGKREWWAQYLDSDATADADLNRAICECVARMQADKEIHQ